HFCWAGGWPTAAVTDLGDTPNVKIKLIDHADTVDKMNAKYSNLYSTGVIPAKTYPGQDKDNAIAVVQNILVANAKMADKVAYDIVKTFIEKRDELAIVHAEAKNITLENQSLKNSPIPWHPGALKYFAEQGVKRGSCRRAGGIPPPASVGLDAASRVIRLAALDTRPRVLTPSSGL